MARGGFGTGGSAYGKGFTRSLPSVSNARTGAQPGSVRPMMSQMYTGLNVATRPIPIINDYSDQIAARVAAANQRPKGFAVNMPSGPRPPGIASVLGSKVAGATSVRGGVFNPATGLGEHQA